MDTPSAYIRCWHAPGAHPLRDVIHLGLEERTSTGSSGSPPLPGAGDRPRERHARLTAPHPAVAALRGARLGSGVQIEAAYDFGQPRRAHERQSVLGGQAGAVLRVDVACLEEVHDAAKE